MKDFEFLKLLKRYERNEATEQERQLVEAWLEDITRDKESIEVSDEIGEVVRQKLLKRIAKKQQPRTVRFTPWMKVAAAIMLLTVATFTVWQVWQTDTINMVHVQTAGVAEKVILPDGSIIWLKENSVLTYPEKFNGDTRAITFTGEALFEIVKDASHPFVITSNDYVTKVLGTSFNLKTDSLNIEVTVLTGRVALNVIGGASVVVKANEHAVYHDAQKELAIAPLEATVAAHVIAGTEYDMLFNETRMGEVANRIEKKFNVTVKLSDAGIDNCTLTADFTDQSLNETMHLISAALGYSYKVDKGEVMIYGKGCN